MEKRIENNKIEEEKEEEQEEQRQEKQEMIKQEETKQEKSEEQQEPELFKKIEATLFLAARWLNFDELVRYTGVNPIMLKEMLFELEQKYGQKNSAIKILKSSIDSVDSWKMDISQEHAYLTNRLATGESEFTKAEQSTLAIIAYKKPIKQSVVVKIRGNKAYNHIKHFIQTGLIRTKKSGRTFELNLSESFYDYFNLEKNSKNPLNNSEKNKNDYNF